MDNNITDSHSSYKISGSSVEIFVYDWVYRGTINGNTASGNVFSTEPDGHPYCNGCSWTATIEYSHPATVATPQTPKPSIRSSQAYNPPSKPRPIEKPKYNPPPIEMPKAYKPQPYHDIFPEYSVQGRMLAAENKKFNTGQAKIQKTDKETAAQPATTQLIKDQAEQQITYTQGVAANLAQQYHPEPPVVQVLETKKVEEEKKKDGWCAYPPCWKDEAIEWAKKKMLSILPDAIVDDNIKQLVKKNITTIQTYNGTVVNLAQDIGDVVEGQPNDKLQTDLNKAQNELPSDIANPQIDERREIVKTAVGNAFPGYPAFRAILDLIN